MQKKSPKHTHKKKSFVDCFFHQRQAEDSVACVSCLWYNVGPQAAELKPFEKKQWAFILLKQKVHMH